MKSLACTILFVSFAIHNFCWAEAARLTASAKSVPTADDIRNAATVRTAEASATSYTSVLNGSDFGMVCNNDITPGSDGNTADTDGLLAMLSEAKAFSFGVRLILPPGLCEINREIDIPTTQSMRLSGAGIGVTTLQFITPSGATPPTNGLVFEPSNGANLTVDDFSITKGQGSNLGTAFLGTAISITASPNAPNVGDVTTLNLSIGGPSPGAQTDGWNTGLLEGNLTNPVISNVTVTLPGWGQLPDPSGYVCTTGTKSAPCAIHSLPSPSNPVATPSNLGFGTATGVAIEGLSSTSFQADTVISGITVAGGLVGLDLQQFQGAYVTSSKFTANAYGVRTDTFATLSELLAVSSSEFTNAVGGIYANGVGGLQLTSNYLTPDNSDTTNLPGWTAIWTRNDNDSTISANNIVGSQVAVAPEYGIWISADGPDGFPVSITGNTIFSLPSTGSICVGNNPEQGGLTATGNSMFGCFAYIADQNGGNGYSSNNIPYPSQYEDTNRNAQFPKNVTIGTAQDPGSLAIVDHGVQNFYVDPSGDVLASGELVTGGGVDTAGPVSGKSVTSGDQFVMTGSPQHSAAQEVVGNFYFPGGTNGNPISLYAPSGNLPATTAGSTTIFGELTCAGTPGIISWHFDGHYTMIGTTLTPGNFSAAVENDADSIALAKNLQVNSTITPIENPAVPGLQIRFGSAINNVFDCTAVLNEMVLD